MPASRPVRNKNTGEVYPSLTAAANVIGRTPACIRSAIERGGTARGYEWEYANEYATLLRCIETGKTYGTLREAGAVHYLSEAAISRAITLRGTAGGYRWEWVVRMPQEEQWAS